MRNTITSVLTALFFCTTLCIAQIQKLPAPAKSFGKNVMEALWNRSSNTEFSDKMLSDQETPLLNNPVGYAK